MSLKVVGAGFGRTGTHSLKLALEKLGFGPCYHMAEVFTHPGHAEAWLALAEGRSHDFGSVLAGYRSAVDFPVVHFWRELAKANPGAKVILTERDPKVWYESARRTIFPRMAMDPDTAEYPTQLRMAQRIVKLLTFGGNLDEAHVIDVYRRHNDEVRRTIAPERLLVFDGAMGWAPLCEFLQVPVPDEPFPRTNTAEEFQARAKVGGAYHR